jgi:SAM-dependent methyltransferase
LTALDFQQAVCRTREWYRDRDANPAIAQFYAPFQEVQVNIWTRQYRDMACFFRTRGVFSLEGLRILDIGCGRGHQMRTFLEYGADPRLLVGVEIRQVTPEVMAQLCPHLRVEMYDGAHLPFVDATFDLVTQHQMISSVLAPELRLQLCREMWRVLAPGGYIFYWDLLVTQAPNHEDAGKPLLLDELFPDLPREEHLVSKYPNPEECAPGNGRRRRIAQFILKRFVKNKPEYRTALIGPK